MNAQLPMRKFFFSQVNATLATSEIRMRAQQKEINLRYFRDETVRSFILCQRSM